MRLSDFHTASTKRFDVNITYAGEAPNITNDAVSIFFSKTKGGEVVITDTADVATAGISGIANFELSETDTDVAHGRYYYQLLWELSSGEEFVLDDSSIQLLERL